MMMYKKAILILNLFLSLFAFANEEVSKEQNLTYYLKQNYIHGVLSRNDIEAFQKKIQAQILENPISEERTGVSIEAHIHYHKFDEMIVDFREALDLSTLNRLLSILLSEIEEKEKQKEEAREETEDVTSLISQQIALGASCTCALDFKNKLRCWGYNKDGQLGYGDTNDRVGPSNEFIPTGNEKIIQIALGGIYICVLFERGKMKCWGQNYYGQLGYGDGEKKLSPPNEFLPTVPEKIIQMALGHGHTCVLFEQGKIKCWGDNSKGQLGYGDTKFRFSPPYEFVPTRQEKIIQKALGYIYTCALWLGFKEFVQTEPEKITQMALGYSHTCVLFEHGKIKCWGKNEHGQLGYGDTNDRLSPSNEFIPTGHEKIIQMALGDCYTCVLFEQGKTKCWGDNGVGQLGYGDTKDWLDLPQEYLKILE
jgi:alpha-tubulin suppressor-like RCC1 family protein